MKKTKESEAPGIQFEKFVLDNGLQVIFHRDRKLPVVHVNHWFHVGSKNERPGRTGFAHLFEHLMFQGSSNAKGEYFAYVERAGANLREGGVNGTTNEDRTNYFVTVPSANLEYILWLESDRIATLADSLTQKDFDNQREVVRNERRQSVENQPYGRAFKLISENLYPSGHPYSWTVIGSHEDLVAASMDDVKSFFRTYYTPNNLSVCIAGDFDPDVARLLVEKFYGSMAPGPALDRPGVSPVNLQGEKVVEVSDRVPQERVYLVWPAHPFFAPLEADLTLASAMLTDGLSSRLSRRLVYDTHLCSNVVSFNDAAEIAGQFIVMATARPGSDLKRIEESITGEIEKFAQTGPTASELTRAKTKWEYEYVSGLERIGGFGGKADRLNSYNTFLGNPGRFEDDFKRHLDVSRESVQQAVRKSLALCNRLLVRFHPEVSRRGSTPAPDRTQVPDLGSDKKFIVPEIQSTKLKNGLEIYVVERHDLPKIAVVFGTKAGSIADPPDKLGVAHLTMRTIDRGTKSRSALRIEDAMGDLGTSLQGLAGREMSYLSLEVLAKNIGKAMAILSDVVLHPEFPKLEFEREKALHLDALKQESNNPGAVASRIRSMLALGANHPYGRPLRGLSSAIESVGRNDLIGFHQMHWKPGSSALIVTGDISLQQAADVANTLFGSWKSHSTPTVDIPPPQPFGQGKICIVDRQDAAQTVVSQILPGPGRLSDDYYPLKLADAVWGGGFMNRLNLNLRENKGYTYGASSALALFSKTGYWFSAANVQSDKTKETIVEFVNELRDLEGKKPISGSELAEAKANRVRGFAQQFESVARIAGIVAELWSFGIPMSDLQKEPDAIADANLKSVNGVAQKYARIKDSTLLLVGDRSKIEEPVRSLNLGEVVILDDEGKMIS